MCVCVNVFFSRGADDAVAQAGSARGVRAAIEGTLRGDFSKGLFEGSFEGFQHLQLGFSNYHSRM